MNTRLRGKGRKKKTDYPFNFYIVTFEDSFWRGKNAGQVRDINFTWISLDFQAALKP